MRNFHALGMLSCVCETSPERRAELAVAYPDAHLTDSFEEVLADPQVAGVAIATPAVLKLKELVEAGELGHIQYIYSNPPSPLRTLRRMKVGYGAPSPLGERAGVRGPFPANRLNLGKIRREENILWSFAPHDVSVIPGSSPGQALGLVGEMPDRIDAQGGKTLHNQIADVTVSLLSFPSGVKAHVFVFESSIFNFQFSSFNSWLHPFKLVSRRASCVRRQTLDAGRLTFDAYPHSIAWKNHIPVANKADAHPIPFDLVEPLRAECLHFLECIRTRNRPRTDGEEGLRVLTVLQQCQEALGSKTPQKPSPPPPTSEPRPYFAHESAFIGAGAVMLKEPVLSKVEGCAGLCLGGGQSGADPELDVRMWPPDRL